MKNKLPQPETLIAKLPSFGYGPGTPRWTEHKYVKTLECTLPGDGDAYEFIFACSVTGAERRWGTAEMDQGEPVAEDN